MFTGIIEELGKLISIKKGSLEYMLSLAAPTLAPTLNIGDSVAVNGICLTVTTKTNDSFTVDVMPETVKKTNLSNLKSGSTVNLERALTLGTRLGGHLVSGHVDGVGTIKSKTLKGNALLIKMDAPRSVTRYLIDRGSIAVDGISLTVMDFGEDFVVVSIIPHTAKMTTLGFKDKGDTVNLEADLIGKYVERFLSQGRNPGKTKEPRLKSEDEKDTGLTMKKLSEAGFI
jgi:riboflavin synthase